MAAKPVRDYATTLHVLNGERKHPSTWTVTNGPDGALAALSINAKFEHESAGAVDVSREMPASNPSPVGSSTRPEPLAGDGDPHPSNPTRENHR